MFVYVQIQVLNFSDFTLSVALTKPRDVLKRLILRLSIHRRSLGCISSYLDFNTRLDLYFYLLNTNP